MTPSIGFGAQPRACYAVDPGRSKGRLFMEPESPTRTPFQRDRDRIIHSSAFRRLQYKTQVFLYHEGDLYRTRLTHTLEVSQIARSIARALLVDEDLAEALALAHDLGHTPFGHAGERMLDALMLPYGGFDHNAQSLRIVTSLERHYAEFDGLNLAWETLEGLVKHNGPLTDASGQGIDQYANGLPFAIRSYAQEQDLLLESYASIEAQAAAIADDIAYNAHDIDDGLRAGLISLKQLRDLPLIGAALVEVYDRYPGLDDSRVVHEIVRRLITGMVEDVIKTSMANLTRISPQNVGEVRNASETIVGFSGEMAKTVAEIKKFLFENVYRETNVMRVMGNAEQVLKELFVFHFEHPDSMPFEWQFDLDGSSKEVLARRVADYVAGMTDRFAILEHRRLFDVTPELR
ncbi:deoxyguanosinetriphosphate triphosphohydrolase [Cohaesibacter celericrescens]|uniref:Deoxyguanosinetriphosphate triphosphohydrolase-like protein n=1 Tax=Cohaesibacter celericrescens TaxID=2067669 RepID=A0A2N5XTG1_9HYPH|nr:deoxyguanosinetriphosphate triphosphohydrolase [Cohaesibacter celericrescens]PLW77737.1 deoxyguanosinetriphosphate triphosphohydrolase [Cohaesibacter celericrescens]